MKPQFGVGFKKLTINYFVINAGSMVGERIGRMYEIGKQNR